MEILGRAKQNQVEFTARMRLLEAKLLRMLAGTDEEKKRIWQMLAELRQEAQGKTDLEDSSEIECEMALLCCDREYYSDALEHMMLALSQRPEQPRYYLIRARIYRQMERMEDAVQEYQKIESAYSEEPGYYCERAECYDKLKRCDLAAADYEKALTFQDTYRDACHWLAFYYLDQYEETYRRDALNRAVELMCRQLKEEETPYYLSERGKIYLRSMQLELAIRDFEKALKYDDTDWSAYNNLGCCYEYLGQYERAIECFSKSVEYMGERKSAVPYKNMADCYEILRRYKDAVHCYENALNVKPRNADYWLRIGELYSYMGEYQKAKNVWKYAKFDNSYWKCMGDLLARQNKVRKAFYYYGKGLRKAKRWELGKRYCDIADAYSEFKPENAGNFYVLAVNYAVDNETRCYYEYCQVVHYYRLGKREEARVHAERALMFFNMDGKWKEEEYINFASLRPVRLRNFGWIYIGLGQREKGERYLEQMDQAVRCRLCRHPLCYEKFFYRGIYREGNSDYEAAMADYLKSKEIAPCSPKIERAIRKLKEKMDGKADR